MSDETPDEMARPGRRRLTPMEVQQQVFRRAMLRGYNEQDVDDFLDEVTEELSILLEEQRAMREHVREGSTQPLSGGRDVAEGKRMADDMVARAREEAAEILRKARTEAAAGAPGSTAVLQPFLAQERVFLQELSKLIQSHADTVRDMARAHRRAAGTQAKPAPGGSEPQTQRPSTPRSGRGRSEGDSKGATPPERPSTQVEARPKSTGSSGSAGSVGKAGPGDGQQTEASLKELFWGEE